MLLEAKEDKNYGPIQRTNIPAILPVTLLFDQHPMNTHIWRYRDNQRNYPGYHMSADADGCAALLAWLRTPKGRTEFRLQPVTQEALSVPNNQGGSAAYVACTLLKLHVKPDAARGHFLFSEVSGRLSLECSHQQVECIIKGVEDIRRGEGDYCIGGDGEQVLWFWWYPRRVEQGAPANRR